MKPTPKRGQYAVDTLEIRSKIGRFDTCNGNAKPARAFPGVTESRAYCLMPSKQAEHCIGAYPTGGHATQLEHHRRGRPVLLGAVVHQQVQT